MDREAGIKAYESMISAEEYRSRLAHGDDSVVHRYTAEGESPVIQVEFTRVKEMAEGITKYEFAAVDGSELPAWQAGAHLDLVIAPEFLGQYSLSGNPADRSRYQIGVLREERGRGGSALLQRIFSRGRRVFISRPINLFALSPDATLSILMGGGIGIRSMIAMAHELHAQGRDFILHYSGRSRASMRYLDDLASFPWRDKVHLHISDEGSRVDLNQVLAGYKDDWHVYTCGATR